MLAANLGDALAPYERGEKTRREMAAELGISVQWLRKLLARERRQQAESQPCEPDEHDLPHLAITDDPARERGHWYEPESGAASVDTGRVRIANHSGTRLRVLPINGGRKTEETIKQHQPDPDGLRGGVG
jgi:hypothetical protein